MSYSSDLPQLSVIFIFVNEALSVLLRSIHTAIQRTPSHLLKEIILVDDHSSSCKTLSIIDVILKGSVQYFMTQKTTFLIHNNTFSSLGLFLFCTDIEMHILHTYYSQIIIVPSFSLVTIYLPPHTISGPSASTHHQTKAK